MLTRPRFLTAHFLTAHFLIASLALLLAIPGMAAQTTTKRDASSHFFEANTGDLKAELADARAAGKKAVLLVYEQEGCPACLYMHQNVLNRVDVQTLYRRYFVSFTVDINGAVPLKDFDGRDITEKSLATRARVRGTPTFAFHDLGGTEIVRIVGAVRDVDEFRLLAEFVAGGHYKNRGFTEHKIEHKKLQLRKKGT